MMTDTNKFKQFIDELQKATTHGNFPRDMLDFARNMLIVGGSMVDSQVIIGTHNVINVYPKSPEKKDELNESSLLANALKTYRDDKAADQGRGYADPYPGLSAYRIQDANRFFGREQAIAELTVELEQRQVTWLHGRSGTGKSSLIQAGLMPALLKKDAFVILVRSVDESPTLALKKELLKRRWSNDLKLSEESLLQFLSKVDETLKGRQIYIFFDQFEEFILKLPEAKQEEFARELADCVADASIPVHFIFSLRSDYFGETTALRKRLKDRAGGEYLVRSLKTEEARRVVVGPLEQFGITYQDGLVETILQHLGSGEVVSPQLQLVCSKLFHTLPEQGRQITFAQYQKLGETKGIITDYLKQVLHDQTIIPSNQYKAATYILSTLVTLDGRRDIKKASDWHNDGRLPLLTPGWPVDHKHLPAFESALAMQVDSPVMAASFIEYVKAYVSVQEDDLRQIVNNILERQALKKFVDNVILSLRDARLLHEIQSEDGELSYELMHDYLVEEVKGWLDTDEKSARQLLNKLNQARSDFKQYKFLLEPKELDIIFSQLGNPKLLLQDLDKHLLLLSAAANGSGQQWLALSGSNGLNWLREACWDESLPENIRQGAAALLGEVDDEETFDRLVNVEQPGTPQKMDLLARYVNRSTQKRKLSGAINLLIFYKLAGLKVKDGAGERAKIRGGAAILAAICVAFHLVVLLLNPENSGKYDIPIVLMLAILGAGVAFVFAEVMTRASLIVRHWNMIFQILILAGLGSMGTRGVLFLFLSDRNDVRWLSGAIIGLTLVLMRIKTSVRAISNPIVLSVATGVLIMLLAFDTPEQVWMEIPSALFAGIYVYIAALQSKLN